MTGPLALTARIRLPLARFALDVDFTTQARMTGIFGPSGAGKTSLLEALLGLRPRTTGFVALGPRVFQHTERRHCLPPERRHIGYVPQDSRLFPHKNVRDNLLAGSPRAIRAGHPIGDLLRDVSTVLKLTDLHARDVSTLSGGERQRVALGRALCSGPELLLLDEPLASLDLPLRRQLLPFLRRVHERFQIPTLLVSHDPVEVQAICEDLLILREGAILAQGPPRKVLTDPRVLAATPEGFENVLSGSVIAADENSASVRLDDTDPLLVLVVPPLAAAPFDRALVSVRASDILIATAGAAGLSARNVLPAEITAVHPAGAKRIVLTRFPGSSSDLAALVTESACQELDLVPGRTVQLVIKSSSCLSYLG